MQILPINYSSDHDGPKKPLMIGCSGGGGHIAAIQGICDFLKHSHQGNIDILKHKPVFHEDKRSSWRRKQMQFGAAATNDVYILSPIIKKILDSIGMPVLPESVDFNQEITTLNNQEIKRQDREYIDMLLDIYTAGYESAAIWNILQRKDQVTELKKLIQLQRRNDQENYPDVYEKTLSLLQNADLEKPYTEIISTQAMGLPALCDAVKQYNHDNGLSRQNLVIHQYMTDLPTKGAVHFFNSLQALTLSQQQQMKLYGVGLTQEIINYFFPKGHHFKGLYNIPSNDNPMVRAGFKNPQYNNSPCFNQSVTLNLLGESPIKVHAKEQIASIMLGSQASHDTVEYIETLIQNGMKKIFVFGGTNEAISRKIDLIISDHPNYANKIIRLGKQDDKHIAQLMTRSNIAVIRGGGLSVMEQMAMPHNRQQTILIHHANSTTQNLTSGISWEDENVTHLIADLKHQQVHAEKTSPEQAKRHIAESRIIATAKEYQQWTTDEIIRYIKNLPSATLFNQVALLKKNKAQSHQALIDYLTTSKENEKRKQLALNAQLLPIINDLLNKCKAYKDYINDPEKSKVPEVSNDSIDNLLYILNNESYELPIEKLKAFKNEYEKPETRAALLFSHDSFILQFFREVNYLLSKMFIFSSIGLETFFTPEQKLRQQMEIINPRQYDI